MSINTANTPDGLGVLLYNGETIVIFARGVEMTLGTSQNQNLEGRRQGTIYLTSHRIIFMPDAGGWLKSFEIPFNNMQDVNLNQPIFGANYLCGTATAVQGGQMRGEVPWRMTFNRGGCIEFGQSLLQAVERASRMRPQNAPPAYSPPIGDFYSAPPAYYQPSPDQGPNGFNPTTDSFPDQPNPSSVFMSSAPPPYPGIGPERGPHPTEELHVAGQFEAPPAYSGGETAEGLRRRN
ncbi:hypothetical protein CRE_22564 [Caenorhabditis remanei]|uniref:GRAM domain-containing protein n=2 Tax=Caenorhabditis TaxID=6237 RepID=E3N381_CAERE|nr:hypothetical protein CRE_22564 [Caenorhabditis remanei]